MKFSTPAILVSAALVIGGPLLAEDAHHDSRNKAPANAGKLIPCREKDAVWVATARNSYPLEMCVASEEKLGSMGKSLEYLYRAEGKPDRLVVFCCAGCEEDFMKQPVRYLAKLDAAAKTRGAPDKASTAQKR